MSADSSKPVEARPWSLWLRRAALLAAVLALVQSLPSPSRTAVPGPRRAEAADTVGCRWVEGVCVPWIIIEADTVGCSVARVSGSVFLAWAGRRGETSVMMLGEWHGDGPWQFTAFDSAHAYGSGIAMAIDAQSHPVIAFSRGDRGDLVIARRGGGPGARFTFESPLGAGMSPSIARVGGDGLGVAYTDERGRLKYAEQRGDGTWNAGVVDGTRRGLQPSLVATGSGRAIAYYDAARGDLRVARRGARGWSSRTVDAAGDVGQHPSMAGNAATGRLGIAYYGATSRDLKYAFSSAAGWRSRVVDADGDVGRVSSLVLHGRSPGDSIGIAYHDATHRSLRYAMKTGRWVRTVLDSRASSGAFVASTGFPVPGDTLRVLFLQPGRPGIRYQEETGPLDGTRTVSRPPGTGTFAKR